MNDTKISDVLTGAGDFTTKESTTPTKPRFHALSKTYGKIKVYIVDGKWVRREKDIDFTDGGTNCKYDWIPKGEVWIDNGQETDEIDYVIVHEMTEYILMNRGLDYDHAHSEANRAEMPYRIKDKGVPSKVLEELGAKLTEELNLTGRKQISASIKNGNKNPHPPKPPNAV